MKYFIIIEESKVVSQKWFLFLSIDYLYYEKDICKYHMKEKAGRQIFISISTRHTPKLQRYKESHP